MYRVKFTSSFKKRYKRMKKRGYTSLVVRQSATGLVSTSHFSFLMPHFPSLGPSYLSLTTHSKPSKKIPPKREFFSAPIIYRSYLFLF